jgi:hypothetical protein
VTVEPFSVVVRGASGEVLRSRPETTGKYGRFAPTLDRPTYETGIVPGWDDYRAGDGEWVHGAAARIVERTAARTVIEWPLGGDRVRTTLSVDGARVFITSAVEGADGGAPAVRYNKTSLAFALPADEHFFGLGERFATFDHRGWSLYSWAEEGPLGAARPGEPVPERTVDDVLPRAVLPLVARLRDAREHRLAK